ncbi:nitroreductase family protein [Vitreoscilla sp. C1]|uniref:nitroreductase family protein n=1 Tax=Vitreoscilla sp. (strain C1) TaxID=96942 RepID=UPI000CDC30AF|nr:nitroreductase family protein [Vitreoscilla sp. C1]AUZ06232.1 nitroreductase family protein [Vitreoscilla sp. C1]
MSLLDDLRWRYAAKHLNGNTVPQQDVDDIVEAARLAPSSSGLQPYHVFVIRNPELLAQLSQCVYGNQQVKNCSPLLVFAAWNTYTEARINEVFELQNRVRNVPDSLTDAYRTRLIAQVAKQDLSEHRHHADKQAFLAAMCAMNAAAERRIDCTPMEGFEADKVDAILGLAELDLHAALLLPLGYRDEEVDWLLKLPKYRRNSADFITHLD